MTTVLRLAPPSTELLEQFRQLAVDLEYPTPLVSPSGCIFITTDADGGGQAPNQVLVAGVTIHKTDGPYIYFEDFLLNPEFPLKVRGDAAYLLGDQIRVLCTVAGKLPVCPVTVKGAVKILQKLGFEGQTVALMTRPPMPVTLDSVFGDTDVSPEEAEPAAGAAEAEDAPEVDPIVSGKDRPVLGRHRVSARRPGPVPEPHA